MVQLVKLNKMELQISQGKDNYPQRAKNFSLGSSKKARTQDLVGRRNPFYGVFFFWQVNKGLLSNESDVSFGLTCFGLGYSFGKDNSKTQK